MRKYYLDNLRVFCILLLFPVHTAMVFNDFGESFYIHGQTINGLTIPLGFIMPWWMSLLFTISGISAAFALKKRSTKKFFVERVKKLLIPLLVGIVLIIPVQSYIADVFWNGYEGNYFVHYAVYFTKFTDLVGYDGGFTPAHLWFMLFLFIVSVAAIPLIVLYKKRNKQINGKKIKIWQLFPLFLVILVMTPVLDFAGGKSIGEAFALFVIGYFLLSLDEVQELLEKNWILLLCLFVGISFIYMAVDMSGLLWDIVNRIMKWFGILAFLGVWKKFFDKTNPIMQYLSKAAFPLYYFHQSILVVFSYLILKTTLNVSFQYISIMLGTFLFSILCYEICRRFKITQFLFGIK